MTKYLVTNISLTKDGQTFEGKKTVTDFDFPLDLSVFRAWNEEYYEGFQWTDNEVRAIWLRSVLFMCYMPSFDFYPLADDTKYKENDKPTFWLADMPDEHIDKYVPLTVTVDVPRYEIIDINDEDLRFTGGDLKQAIFEKLTHHMHVSIDVFSITDTVLSVMKNAMRSFDPPSPDSLAEIVCETIEDEEISDQKLQEIFDAVHNLSSVLVKKIPEYI
jgi:hypothetical protein